MYYLAKNNYTLKNVNINFSKGMAGFTEIRHLEDFVIINADNKHDAEKLADKYFNKKDYAKKSSYQSEIIVYDSITFAEEEL